MNGNADGRAGQGASGANKNTGRAGAQGLAGNKARNTLGSKNYAQNSATLYSNSSNHGGAKDMHKRNGGSNADPAAYNNPHRSTTKNGLTMNGADAQQYKNSPNRKQAQTSSNQINNNGPPSKGNILQLKPTQLVTNSKPGGESAHKSPRRQSYLYHAGSKDLKNALPPTK